MLCQIDKNAIEWLEFAITLLCVNDEYLLMWLFRGIAPQTTVLQFSQRSLTLGALPNGSRN